MLPLLSALSSYLLKSLRLDNGRAAKITLLGPGRAGFLSPYPRPHLNLLQPWPCWDPPFPSPGRLFPAGTACTCAWQAPPLFPGLEPPTSKAPSPGRPRQCGHHGRSHWGECQGWFCSSPLNSAWEGVCECCPTATSIKCRGMPGSCAFAPPTACTSERPSVAIFPSPSPLVKPGQLKSFFGGGSAGEQGERTRGSASPLHPLNGERLVGDVAGVRGQAVVWFPTPER